MNRRSRASAIWFATIVCFGVGSACRDLGEGFADVASAGASQSTAGGNASAGAAPSESDAGHPEAGAMRTQEDQGGQGGAPEQPIHPTEGGAPDAGGSSDPGAAGAVETAGAAGAESVIDSGIEEVLEPGCASGLDQGISFTEPSAMAADMTGNNVPYVLYATQPQTNVVYLRWKNALSDDATWTPWQCFDLVPHPSALSAINIGDLAEDTTPEIYAASTTGQLFVRRFYEDITWLAWQSLDLPRASSHVSDVAATTTPATLATVYILDEGKVFTRHHLSINPYSDYSPWVEINGVPQGAAHLCAATRADQAQQLFVSTSDGAVLNAVQQSADASAAFGSFEPIGGAASITDIDCGYLADGSIAVFGLSAGKVMSHSANAAASSDWQTEPGGTLLQLTTFTVGSRAGVAPTVFGVDDGNTLWWHAAGSVTWTQIPN
jgi:hypothetical protein